jgi:hypothetical protein
VFFRMKNFPAPLLIALAPLLFTACATIAPPQPPTLELPKPPSDLRAVRKGDRVVLTWTVPRVTTDRQIIHTLGPTKICRGPRLDATNCGTPVGESVAFAAPKSSGAAKKKVEVSYTDTLPSLLESDSSSDVTFYAVQVLNADGRAAGLSNRVPIFLVRTLPPPREFHAQLTDAGIVLNWMGEALPALPALHYAYRVYRRAGNEKPKLVGEIPAAQQSAMTLADPEIEWQSTYEYRIETDTLIDRPDKPSQRIEGEESPAVTVFAEDKFPPSVPGALQAVFSGPGQRSFIDLVWAPDSEADLAGYNVYRHAGGAPPVKLNADPVQAPAYRDFAVDAGKRYTYSVSAVDVRGNESGHSAEASETVP